MLAVGKFDVDAPGLTRILGELFAFVRKKIPAEAGLSRCCWKASKRDVHEDD
jgi:hypothetical protein